MYMYMYIYTYYRLYIYAYTCIFRLAILDTKTNQNHVEHGSRSLQEVFRLSSMIFPDMMPPKGLSSIISQWYSIDIHWSHSIRYPIIISHDDLICHELSLNSTLYIYTHIHMCTHIHTYIHTYIYIYTYIHTYIYIYYIYIYIYILIYTHI